MEGSYRIAGSPLPALFLGRMRLLHPLRIKDYGSLELTLLAKRRSALASVGAAGSDLSPSIITSLMSRLGSVEDSRPRCISIEKLRKFMDSREGLSVSLWLMFREKIDFESVRTEVFSWGRMTTVGWIEKRDLVSCVDLLASRDWEHVTRGLNEDEPEHKDGSGFKWRSAYRNLRESFAGVDIGELTLYQFRAISSGKHEAAGVRRVPLSEAKSDPVVRKSAADVKARKSKLKDEWRQMQRKNTGSK